VVGTVAFAALLLTLGFVLLTLCRHRTLRADAGMLLGIFGCFLTDSMTTEGLAAPANVSSVWLFILVAWAETLRRQGGDPLPAVQRSPAETVVDAAGWSGTTVTASAQIERAAEQP
jgi:hypothetical protein